MVYLDSDHDIVTFSSQTSPENLFLLKNYNKKEDMSYDFTFS